MSHEDDEVREVTARIERIEVDLLSLLQHHECLHDQPPRFSRAVGIHVLIDLAARLMLSELQERGEVARPPFLAMVQQLELLLMPKATVGTH